MMTNCTNEEAWSDYESTALFQFNTYKQVFEYNEKSVALEQWKYSCLLKGHYVKDDYVQILQKDI